jgi:hypothetical protein
MTQSALLTKADIVTSETKSTSQMFMTGHILSYRYITEDKPGLFKSFHTKVLSRSEIDNSIISFEQRTLARNGKLHLIKVFSSNDPYMTEIWDKLLENKNLHWKDKLTSLREACRDLRSRVLYETPEHSLFREDRAKQWAMKQDKALLDQINFAALS